MPITTTVKKRSDDPMLVNELHMRSADRSNKDISTWRHAHISAESVHHPNRSRLYDIYDDVLLDGHLSGIIGKRIDAVLNKSIYFEHDGKRVAELDGLINSLAFRDIVRTIMQTIFWGVSGLEFVPGRALAFNKLPRKHIKPEYGIIAYDQQSIDGVPYAALANVWVMGSADDLGLLLRCAPYAIYKRGGLSDWAEYIEMFGQPVRIIKYDAYDEQTKAELKKVLDESGSSLALMIPKQADFDIKDGRSTYGDGRLQQIFMKAMNDELSTLVLGNTETTTSSGNSGYAQSKVHAAQQDQITRSDIIYTANMLNDAHFISILRSYGYPVGTGRFVFDKDIDIAYLKDRLAIDKEVAGIVPIATDHWYNTYGIPKA